MKIGFVGVGIMGKSMVRNYKYYEEGEQEDE